MLDGQWSRGPCRVVGWRQKTGGGGSCRGVRGGGETLRRVGSVTRQGGEAAGELGEVDVGDQKVRAAVASLPSSTRFRNPLDRRQLCIRLFLLSLGRPFPATRRTRPLGP